MSGADFDFVMAAARLLAAEDRLQSLRKILKTAHGAKKKALKTALNEQEKIVAKHEKKARSAFGRVQMHT